MAIEILPSRTLLGVYRDDRHRLPSDYWRRLGGFDQNTFLSTRQDIVFEKITTTRKVAPFVLPQNSGRPIYKREGSSAKLFRPAYIKPKDAVVPWEQMERRAGNIFDDTPRTPEQNNDAEIAEVMRQHRDAIERRWEWMAAQAMIYGQVTVEYEDGPSVVVDYGRASGNTIIDTTGNWDDPDYDIFVDLQEYVEQMAAANFGAIPSRITVGRNVWRAMRRNNVLKEHLDTNVRGGRVTIERGLVTPVSAPENNSVLVATIGGTGVSLDVYLYSDFYETDDGTQVEFMNPNDLVLTAPNVEGVMAFGAIVDHDADLRALAVFPKMWRQPDPSGTFIMTQSAPLPIVVHPNRTLRARVGTEDSNSDGNY